MDIVSLKVDEPVLMDDSSIAHKMNSYFSPLFTTEDNVNLSYTLVGCLLTKKLYTLIVLPGAIIDYGFWVLVLLMRSYATIRALSLLPPLLVGRNILVEAGHVTTCDTFFSTGVARVNE